MNENGQRNMESDVKIYSRQKENVKIYPNESERIHLQLESIKPELVTYLKSYPFTLLA